jgi:hypothetical protein
MKKLFSILLCVSPLLILVFSFNSAEVVEDNKLRGAWQSTVKESEHSLLFVDGYFTQTVYNISNKKFSSTRGGSYSLKDKKLSVHYEWDTENPDNIGNTVDYHFTLKDGVLQVAINNQEATYKRTDKADTPLSGVWRITERLQDGALVPIHQSGTRKTIKILSATRFQWAAIDPATKLFAGTGGGRYTFENGKYTEHIEFFSRDSSRVGAELSFDGKLVNGKWHHSGLSSQGDKIYEVWSKTATSKN